jgi:hypothetical protein
MADISVEHIKLRDLNNEYFINIMYSETQHYDDREVGIADKFKADIATKKQEENSVDC